MALSSSAFDALIDRFVADRLQPDEVEKFFVFLEQEGFREQYAGQIDEAFLEHRFFEWSNKQQGEQLYHKILEEGNISRRSPVKTIHRIHFLKTIWFKYAAAVILFVGIGAYLYTLSDTEPVPEKSIAIQSDIKAPLSSRATITLASGEQVFLDSAANGILATDGNAEIKKTADGEIVYSSTSGLGSMNTLMNPRGSRPIVMTLADGSKVWLNSESSLTYPTAFAGNQRRVQVKGEAYFEITANASKPFLVTNENMEVIVLGTHFNVNAYRDNGEVKVTLVEGAVKVKQGIAAPVLKPGQQAQVSQQIEVISHVNIAEVVAWKNGVFNFNEIPLKDAMNEIARWYDVNVVYEGELPPFDFYGKIGRDLTLKQVLSGLSGSGVQFTLTNAKTLVISPMQK